MPTRFCFNTHESYPKLSWVAILSKGSQCIQVHMGSQVERWDNGFVEGAWNRPFTEYSPQDASVVCGTGGLLQGAKAIFFCATDNYTPVFSIRKGNKLYVSNSPILAMAMADEYPDNTYPFYHLCWVLLMRHGFSSNHSFPTASGLAVRMHIGLILELGNNLSIKGRHYPLHPSFTTFEEYSDILHKDVKLVLDNAACDKRQFSYGSITTCSGGYDSNACAVLGKRAGCKEAFTYYASNTKRPIAIVG